MKLLTKLGIGLGLLSLVGGCSGKVSKSSIVSSQETQNSTQIIGQRDESIILVKKSKGLDDLMSDNLPPLFEKGNYLLFYKKINLNERNYSNEGLNNSDFSKKTEIVWNILGNKIKITDKLHPSDGKPEFSAFPLGKIVKYFDSDSKDFVGEDLIASVNRENEEYKIKVDDDFINLSKGRTIYFSGDNLSNLRKAEINQLSPGTYELKDPLIGVTGTLTSVVMLTDSEIKNFSLKNEEETPFVFLGYGCSDDIPEIKKYLGPGDKEPAQNIEQPAEKVDLPEQENNYSNEAPEADFLQIPDNALEQSGSEVKINLGTFRIESYLIKGVWFPEGACDNTMNPNDGNPEIYVTNPTSEGTYIFADNDFRKQVGEINIYVGFSNKASFMNAQSNYKKGLEYHFTGADGIYADLIKYYSGNDWLQDTYISSDPKLVYLGGPDRAKYEGDSKKTIIISTRKPDN